MTATAIVAVILISTIAVVVVVASDVEMQLRSMVG